MPLSKVTCPPKVPSRAALKIEDYKKNPSPQFKK
jgi:hypothetical protein